MVNIPLYSNYGTASPIQDRLAIATAWVKTKEQKEYAALSG